MKELPPTFNYFLKGDISGIQEFIFNVKSEKAARVLKARSIFVEVLSLYGERFVTQQLGRDAVKPFYNGGGTFFLQVNSDLSKPELDGKVKEWESIIVKKIFHEEIYLSLNLVAKDDSQANQFHYWKDAALQSNKDKLQKYWQGEDAYHAFDPYYFQDKSVEWLKLGQKAPKRKGMTEVELSEVSTLEQQEYVLEKAMLHFELENVKVREESKDSLFFERIQNKLPEWRPALFNAFNEEIKEADEADDNIRRNSIIDYHFLARFAETRTGTKKLGILKMDVDNLGLLFNDLTSEAEAEKLSGQFRDFFSKTVNELLDFTIDTLSKREGAKEENPIYFRDNIYTIFSGGDDCFFVGGWDAILSWAALVHREFTEMAKEIPAQPTISAGVVLLEPTYPVIRFAHLAEDALGAAKAHLYDGETKPTKNKVCLFDEILTWEEFGSAQKTAKKLQQLIEQRGEPRGILDRIRKSASGFKKSQEQALLGCATGPGVANLFYYIRHSKNADDLKNDLVKPYAEDLIRAFAEKKPTNPMKYPVAARWAEFLTRKKEQDVPV